MTALFALPALLGLSGCTMSPTGAGWEDRIQTHTRIRARTQEAFERAALYKPQTFSTESMEATMAPLIVHQLGAATDPADIATVFTVFSERSSIRVRQDRYPQVRYWWTAPAIRLEAQVVNRAKYALTITVGPDGFPLVYEVLRPASSRFDKGIRVFFVSRSWEEQAARVYGPPLTGRRYAIERSVSEAPDVVVAGVVEDGPIPMGPYVYVNAQGIVTTLRCRCDAAPVEEIPYTAYYDLVSPRGSHQVGAGEDRIQPPSSSGQNFTDLLRWPTD